jgi:hypothetical protein
MAKSKSQSQSNVGGGCLMVIALPFAAVGLFMAGLVVRDLVKWSNVQDWVATPATLLEAKLQEKRDKEGSTTYRAIARYRYRVNGKAYESTRVAVHEDSDNVGSYNRDHGRELEGALRDRRPITCYVNPDDPTEAILYRDLRPGYLAFKSLFAIVFGGVGLGLVCAAISSIRTGKRLTKRQQQYPGEPWKWRDDWRVGRLEAKGGAMAWGLGILATLWNLITWPALVELYLLDALQFSPQWLFLLFPMIGALLAWWAAYVVIRRIKWGVSEFELVSIPGVLGGPLAGMVHVPRRVAAENGYTIRLACVQTIRERSGGKSSTREVTRWSHAKTISRDLRGVGNRTTIPVQFIVPYDLPASDRDDITWKLTAEAATEGVDYHAEFDVPVFETEASSQTPPADVDDADSLYATPHEFATVVSHMHAVLEEDFPDRRVIYFPMARNRGLAIGLSVIAANCVVVTAVLYVSPAPIWFPILMGLFSLLMLAIALNAALERSRLEFGPRAVAYQRKVIRCGKRHEFTPEQIKTVKVEKSGTEVNGVRYWNVVLKAQGGEDHALATEIKDRQIADRLAEEVSTAVGLSKSSPIALESELPVDLR